MESLSPLIFFSAIVLFILTFVLLRLFACKQSPASHGLKSYPIVGTLPHLIKNSNRLLDWSTELLAANKSGGTVAVFPFVFTIDPSCVEHVTKSNFDNYPKSQFVAVSLYDLFGEGILNVDGEPWKQQRKLSSFEFSTSSIRCFVLEKVRRKIERSLVPLLASACKSGAVVDLQDVMERFAFDSISEIVFDYDPDSISGENAEGDRFFRVFEEAVHISVDRAKLPFSAIWKLKKLLDVGAEKRLREAFETLNGTVNRFISADEVIGTDEKKRDFLSQFKRAGMQPDKSLRDLLVNLMIAGRDTTPSALTWFFWVLSTKPTIVAKILEEIRSIRRASSQEHLRDDQSVFTLDSLRDMHYLQAAISESMRLHPPVTLLARQAASHDTLPDGTAVRKGCMVMINTFAMGRSERVWGEDCAEYKPERWLADDGAFRKRKAAEYPVFFAGPRMCLGKDLAYIQMKAVAASILERFEFEAAAAEEEEGGRREVSLTLRMEGGLPVRVRERIA